MFALMGVGKKKRTSVREEATARAGTGKTAVERKPATKASRARSAQSAGTLRELPDTDPFAEMPPQPEWVTRDFPEYVEGSHVSGPVSTRRVSYAGGHEIEIITTYSVNIDGRATPVHMLVDTDGRLWSHLCPYATFANASALIAHLVEQAPEALTNIHAGHTASGHTGSGHTASGHAGVERDPQEYPSG
jgi:hypothetical protein